MPEKLRGINEFLRLDDENIFLLLGTFRRHAKQQGWTDEAIHQVFDEVKQVKYKQAQALLLSQYDVDEADEAFEPIGEEL